MFFPKSPHGSRYLSRFSVHKNLKKRRKERRIVLFKFFYFIEIILIYKVLHSGIVEFQIFSEPGTFPPPVLTSPPMIPECILFHDPLPLRLASIIGPI